MNNDPSLKAKRLLAGALIVLLAWTGFTIWHQLTFHIVSTEPSVSKVSTIAPFFKVTFSQTITDSGLSIQSSQSNLIGTPLVAGKVLTIPFKAALTSGKVYTITLVNVDSSNGKKITNKAFTFKPYYIASSELPADQQQAILKEQIDNTTNSNDPILSHLPYQTTDFTLSEVTTPVKNPPKNLPLLATITLSQADSGDQAAAVAQYKQEVTSYITSLGLNPANYDITYVVQTP